MYSCNIYSVLIVFSNNYDSRGGVSPLAKMLIISAAK